MPNAKSHSAVYLVLRRDQRVLMMLRQNTGYMDGMWDLPAGHVDAGEPATLALVLFMVIGLVAKRRAKAHHP